MNFKIFFKLTAMVANQLNEYFSADYLLPRFQSAYKGSFDINRSTGSMVGHTDGARRTKGTQSA